MKKLNWFTRGIAGTLMAAFSATPVLPAAETPAESVASKATGATEKAPKVPRFSLDYMDPAVKPGADFYRYADGNWVKNDPVPPDKSRWGAFMELQERNWYLIHQILDDALASKPQTNSPTQKVADFFRSAMDTNRIEGLSFKPLQPDLKRIENLKGAEDLLRLLADFHARGIDAGFNRSASPDAKNSEVYAFYLGQGGLGLPDRDYYLTERFAKQREAYAAHVAKMFTLLGEAPDAAKTHAATVLELETALAKASKSRVELRDPIANYHKFTVADIVRDYPDAPLPVYLAAADLGNLSEVIIRQPEFFKALYALATQRPLADWKVYLRWHLLRGTAPYLHAAAEEESFAFYGKVLREQQVQEPRWQRAARVIDGEIGEALGQLFVERNFPPAARARMLELVQNLKAVFHDRLQKADWMTDATRAKALAKFERFTQKIGYPDKFRDYSTVEIRPDDFLGNVQRADVFESRRELRRVGQPVDKTEWHMTPETVNAYFNPLQNEIVFPAGILQPPFFDIEMDDAVNYGAIGVVIGHEITHGYDDQGRKYDSEGNLNDWWTEADAKAFEARAQKVVEQYNAYEPLPGLHVNGELTLGENLADLGGTSIAYEALQRALAKNPAKRKKIDGLTPEQRFFISLSQVWRTNCREAEARRLVTVDPHSPGQFRAVGPHVNQKEFYEAFDIKEGMPMWRAPELRAKIW
ncbi:MAG TPA: M13 family metallopeptidase [Candidatus Binatia bacterium]|nr:M13 family metallopeptidase [Candidatus Binatia bacterium]